MGEVVKLLVQHRTLTWELAKREFTDRHVGSLLGAFWAVGHPLLLMGVYLFVFAFVLKTRVGGTEDLPLDYPAYMLSGLIPWMAFQESMNKSCSSIVDNRSLVKQVVFPVEVLPVKGVVASLLTQSVASFLLVMYVLISHGGLFWTYGLLPVPFLLQFLAMIGVGYALAAVSVYVRDLKDVVQVIGLAGAYVTPIFYLPQWVPSLFQPILYLNPFSYMGWCYQDVLYFGRIEHPWSWVAFVFFSVASFSVGSRLFRKLKVSFGSVL
ncbi:MAG: ABC transporter permease [Nitrospirae bacterium]|nr:ABC transporter permease [Nitrospirota bacterium]